MKNFLLLPICIFGGISLLSASPPASQIPFQNVMLLLKEYNAEYAGITEKFLSLKEYNQKYTKTQIEFLSLEEYNKQYR